VRVIASIQSAPVDPGAPAPSAMSAESFMIAYPRLDPRPVSNLSQGFEALVRSKGWEEGKNPPMATEEVSIGAAVQEGTTPRLVVLGNARGFNDEYLTRARSDMSLELASTCVNWLRERSNLGAKPSDQVKTERKTYKLEMDQRAAGFNRLRFLPPCLAVLMIAGMGAGVWLIRRR
jgi:hypothetical protein